MLVWHSEFCHNYETYSFGYTVYAQPDSADEIPRVYDHGFLPYSDRPELGDDLFYMARSVRVVLERFRVRAEERYVLNKMRDLDLAMDILPKDEVVGKLAAFEPICLGFAAAKFHNGRFTAKRLRYITSRPYLSHIAVFRKTSDLSEPLAFALLVRAGDMMHVWYSFHRVLEALEKNFGKYVIVRLLEHAKAEGLRHCYLGTCYGVNSRYKTDVPGTEFFDGIRWSSDRELLRRFQQVDDLRGHHDMDAFKLNQLESASCEQ